MLYRRPGMLQAQAQKYGVFHISCGINSWSHFIEVHVFRKREKAGFLLECYTQSSVSFSWSECERCKVFSASFYLISSRSICLVARMWLGGLFINVCSRPEAQSNYFFGGGGKLLGVICKVVIVRLPTFHSFDDKATKCWMVWLTNMKIITKHCVNTQGSVK